MDNLTNFFIHANCCAQSAVKNSMDMINWLKNVDSSDKGDLLALIEAQDFFSIVFKLLAQLDEEITCSTQKFSFHCVSHLPEYYKQLTWKTYKNIKRFIDKNVYGKRNSCLRDFEQLCSSSATSCSQNRFKRYKSYLEFSLTFAFH